jgi:predicted nucleic acid-binding protein
MIVVSDTGPIQYLTLLGHVDALANLYGRVLIPVGVAAELSQPHAPEVVRALVNSPPPWLEVVSVVLPQEDTLVRELGRGEREAIVLAETRGADLLLCDDQMARAEAEEHGLRVVGTLRVLIEAHNNGLLDGAEALSRLRATSFRASQSLLAETVALMHPR